MVKTHLLHIVIMVTFQLYVPMEENMFTKRFFSLILVVCLLAIWIVPAAADKPDKIIIPGPLNFPVVNCDKYGYEFWIWDDWDETDYFHFKYNKDGTLNYILGLAKTIHTYTAVPYTGKELVSTVSAVYFIEDLTTNLLTLRGNIQLVTIPGVGRIYAESGNKVFEFYWNPDGTITFNMIQNSGPTSFLSNDYSELCAALAP